jgi:hypothetical protein
VIGEVNWLTSAVMNIFWLLGTFAFAAMLGFVSQDVVDYVMVGPFIRMFVHSCLSVMFVHSCHGGSIHQNVCPQLSVRHICSQLPWWVHPSACLFTAVRPSCSFTAVMVGPFIRMLNHSCLSVMFVHSCHGTSIHPHVCSCMHVHSCLSVRTSLHQSHWHACRGNGTRAACTHSTTESAQRQLPGGRLQPHAGAALE